MPTKITTRIRVLYADTDQMGVVNGGQYVRWLEAARAEWLRGHDCTYKELEDQGYRMPVSEVHLVYSAPARYDELVDVVAWPSAVWAGTVRFNYEVLRADDGVLLATGRTKHACLDLGGKVCRFPAELLTILRGASK